MNPSPPKYGYCGWFRKMVTCHTKLKCHHSPPLCVCVQKWHVLTEQPYTCWLAVNRREMSSVAVRNIFLHSSHVKPWLWFWSWKRENRWGPHLYLLGDGGRWFGCWNMMSDVAARNDWDTPKRGGKNRYKIKSVTQKSYLMLTRLISLATISARFNSHQLK